MEDKNGHCGFFFFFFLIFFDGPTFDRTGVLLNLFSLLSEHGFGGENITKMCMIR